MTNAFKKGQKVTFFRKWDHNGACAYTHAIVYSCGKKVMVLTNAETGEEMGRHFSPTNNYTHNDTVDGHLGESEALDFSAEYIAYEIASLERIMNSQMWPSQASSYRSAIEAQYAKMKACKPAAKKI